MDNVHKGPWLVALAAALWAIDAPFRKYLTFDLSATTIVLMEHVLIVGVVLIVFGSRLKELTKLGWKAWGAVLAISWGGSALATILFTQSFSYVNVSVAILLQKVQPLVAILLATLVLKERLPKQFWLWAVVALAGAYLVSFPELKIQGLDASQSVQGVLLALGAATLWGAATVFGRYVLQTTSFQAMTAVRFIAALVFLLVLSVSSGTITEVAAASVKDWWFVLATALVAGFVSLYIYYKGLANTRASIATLCELAFPFAAVVINWIFLDAQLTLWQIVGGVVLVGAIYKLSHVNTQVT